MEQLFEINRPTISLPVPANGPRPLLDWQNMKVLGTLVNRVPPLPKNFSTPTLAFLGDISASVVTWLILATF